MMSNQPDIKVVIKPLKEVVMIDVIISSGSNIKKKEHGKLEKYQGCKEEMEKMWKVYATVMPVEIRALGAVTLKLVE